MKSLSFYHPWLWCFWLVLSSAGTVPTARAQAPATRTVQVVTRTIEQQLPCPAGTLVRIRAEKAAVRVQGWDQPTVRLVLRLSARHPERAVAEQELPVARYQFEAHGRTIDVVNYFALAASAPALRSDLRADYTLMVPANVAVELRNAYGQTAFTGLTGRQTISQEFGPITLLRLRGSLTVTAKYADLTGRDTDLTLDCDADKSAVSLLGAAGRYTIRNRYGTIAVEPAEGLKSLDIEAERTEVKLVLARPERFSYRLSCSQGPLQLPPELAAAARQSAGRHVLQLTRPAPLPLLRVSTSYAPISIQQPQSLTARP
ncbi:hypothetical protein Q5H92_16080 [Hymenobacter sp. M29]|uniref:Adhesin domain-containing protein n=1 Tax=Hymenobacter mellowenesis TaxID=3063995 RepID=A0ABT9ADI5_9BACT|nr:hypothetical protein [Hymenobacter sp. M29]MDO7847884.1 hypothetical protein [Hymenobacter sp. M29]